MPLSLSVARVELHALHGSLQGGVGIKNQAESHFGAAFSSTMGVLPPSTMLTSMRRFQATGDSLEVFEAFWSLNECDVRAPASM